MAKSYQYSFVSKIWPQFLYRLLHRFERISNCVCRPTTFLILQDCPILESYRYILLTPIVCGKKKLSIPICAWRPLALIMLILRQLWLFAAHYRSRKWKRRIFCCWRPIIYVIEWSAVFMFGFLWVAINAFSGLSKFRKREGGERSFRFDMNYMLFGPSVWRNLHQCYSCGSFR
jgi:hypothetical protein